MAFSAWRRVKAWFFALMIVAIAGTVAITPNEATAESRATTIISVLHQCGSDGPSEPTCRTLCLCLLERQLDSALAMRAQTRADYAAFDDVVPAPHVLAPEPTPPRPPARA